MSSTYRSQDRLWTSLSDWLNSLEPHRPMVMAGIAAAAFGIHWAISTQDKLPTQLARALGQISEHPTSEKTKINLSRNCQDGDEETVSYSKMSGSGTQQQSTVECIGDPVQVLRIKERNCPLESSSGKWLKLLRKTFYLDDDETTVPDSQRATYSWEYVQRTTTVQRHGSHGALDGVEIIATTHSQGVPRKLVLIANGRPPVEKGVIEFPSGIVDPNERPEDAAVRELKEETGMVGTVRSVGPTTYVDPWKSTESYCPVFMEIDEDDPSNRNPVPRPERDEQIQVLLVPLQNSWGHIQNVARHFDYALESKVSSFSQGQYFACTVEPIIHLDDSGKINDLLKYERSSL